MIILSPQKLQANASETSNKGAHANNGMMEKAYLDDEDDGDLGDE